MSRFAASDDAGKRDIVEILRRRLVVEGTSLNRIAIDLGISSAAAWRLAKKHGLPVRSRKDAMAHAARDPAVAQRRRAGLLARHQDPAFNERWRRRMAAMRAGPDFEARRLAALRLKQADPAFREKLRRELDRRRATPEMEAKRRAAAARTYRDPVFVRRRLARVNGCPADVPRWVPDDLVRDFIDFALVFGEEAAASRVRRLKREAA